VYRAIRESMACGMIAASIMATPHVGHGVEVVSAFDKLTPSALFLFADRVLHNDRGQPHNEILETRIFLPQRFISSEVTGRARHSGIVPRPLQKMLLINHGASLRIRENESPDNGTIGSYVSSILNISAE
jgi:hypothetical protein